MIFAISPPHCALIHQYYRLMLFAEDYDSNTRTTYSFHSSHAMSSFLGLHLSFYRLPGSLVVWRSPPLAKHGGFCVLVLSVSQCTNARGGLRQPRSLASLPRLRNAHVRASRQEEPVNERCHCFQFGIQDQLYQSNVHCYAYAALPFLSCKETTKICTALPVVTFHRGHEL